MTGLGGRVHFRGETRSRSCPFWGLTCGYFRDLWTEKSKLASMLVIWSPRGPRVPMAWGGCVGAAGYPMGCQIGRLTRHETPLPRPAQATKISKPNHFAYPFRSRPRGVPSPPPARFGRGQDVQLLRYGKFGGWCPPPSSTYPLPTPLVLHHPQPLEE